MQEYGVATAGLYQWIDVAAFEASYTEEQQAEGHKVITYGELNANPREWLAFPEEIENEVSALRTEIEGYTEEMISKFLLGQKPMSEWDAFQEGLTQMGVDKLMSYYTDTYNSVVAAAKQ